MPKSGLRVGVAFGGRSVEHDVSIITGLQALEALSERHLPVPIYIARSGAWYAGEELRDIGAYRGGDQVGERVLLDIHRGRLVAEQGRGSLLRRGRPEQVDLDCVVLATHGTEGEDGCLQGALELARLPYVGPPVGAAAAAMDKVTTKAILAAASLPAVEYLAVRREEYERDRAGAVGRIEGLSFPVYVKPANLGSSVGVSRCEQPSELSDALELCFELDRVCIAEPAVEGGREINCAAIGRPGSTPRASVCEQPISAESFLSFQDKYLGGAKGGAKGDGPAGEGRAGGAGGEGAPGTGGAGVKTAGSAGAKGGQAGAQSARRLVPAPIDEELTRRIQALTCRTFEAFGCAGVARVDFLIDGRGEVYVNECNTIPGSFSFYLWEPAGVPFADLMDELIDIALAERAERDRTTTVFETNLLAEHAGAKR